MRSGTRGSAISITVRSRCLRNSAPRFSTTHVDRIQSFGERWSRCVARIRRVNSSALPRLKWPLPGSPTKKERIGPGAQLDPYTIHSALGAGGMGEVYRATGTRLDRTVAIKILSLRSLGYPKTIQRFEREARAASKVNHPNTAFSEAFAEPSVQGNNNGS
jgi:serine/threonine protein kinase